jgi:hypothetical protein
VLFAKYNENNQVKDDDVGRACSRHGNKNRGLVGKPEEKETNRKINM